jgi:importin subunit alpha-6/7
MVLEADAMQRLLVLLEPGASTSQSMVRNATWTLSNFCRGKPAPDFERTRIALPTLKHLIMQSDGETDDEILTDACWALSYLSDGPNERIQAVNHANICRRLVELLQCGKDAVLVPALRTVGNIVTGTDEQTQAVINCNALQVQLSESFSPAMSCDPRHFLIGQHELHPIRPDLLSLYGCLCLGEHSNYPRQLRLQALYGILSNAQRHKKSIIKEACWTISNITAGTKEQINAVIESGCIDPIVHLLKHGELEIKREAAWAISNATSGGELGQIQQLVQYGCIPPLCDLLRVMDQRVVQVRDPCLEMRCY